MRKISRRRSRISRPFLIVLPALLVGSCLVAALALSAPVETPAADPIPSTEAPAEPILSSVPEEPPVPAPPPAHVTTASGIPCTLTELAEDAVYTGELVLVNNWTLYHFPEEQELASIYEDKSNSYYVRDMEVYLSPTALDALNRLMDAFLEHGGSKTVNVIAGYRTKEFQQHLFDQSADRNGQDHAEKYVAQPGGSEHHTGLVVDLSVLRRDGVSADYDGSGEYAWINENCQDYGYIVRYETGKEELTGIWDEPWHFRYIGVPHATELVRQGLCLEEYIDYLRQFPFDGDHLMIDCAEGTYEVWYTEGTQVYLPDEEIYQISGNNIDGMIVTCRVET